MGTGLFGCSERNREIMFYRKDPKDQQRELDRKPTEEEIRYGANPTCFGVHERLCVSCDETSCRNWIDFEEDLKSVATSLIYTDIPPTRVTYITLNQWFDKSLLNENMIQPIYFPSVNYENYIKYLNKYNENYQTDSNQIAFLSYDLTGLVYYLLFKNNFIVDSEIFYKKNSFKGKIGIFEIDKNIITHQLNFYVIENKQIRKIF